MTQLRLWNDEYLDTFRTQSDLISSFEDCSVKKTKQELWELSEDNAIFKPLKEFERKKDLESLALGIGLSNNQAKALYKISQKRNLINETYKAFELLSKSYERIINLHKKMSEDPVSFYEKNKKLKKTENPLLTYGSLSLSYSFCSPYRLISSILKDAENVKMAIDLNDEIYGSEEVDFESFVLTPSQWREQEMKYKAFLQDLRGNKTPDNLFKELLEKIKFEKRSQFSDGWGWNKITKESLIDSFYIFFGSKRGSEFVKEWKENTNHEKLKDEFEYLIYNNPYVNPALVDGSLEKFLSERHIESSEYFLNENKGIDLRYKDGNEFSSWSRLEE